MLKADGVFQGGGVKATAFTGAICRLEKEGMMWQRLAGTSAGAIIAAFLAAGYRGKEIKKIMYDLDYEKVGNITAIKKFPLAKKSLGLILEKGIFSTVYIEKYLEEVFKNKGKTKFKHISLNGQSPLKIIASDVTNKRLLILPDDIKKYGMDPMELEISKAVTMSISIPFFFTPVKLKYMGKEAYIVDGGITSNYPIWIFDVKDVPRWPTFGFKLGNDGDFNRTIENKDFISYIVDVVETTIDSYDESYLRDKDKIRTISIPALGVKTTEFNISLETKEKLYKEGYEKADEFLKKWDFRRYIRSYRI
ncbi:patatin-like phospholipase family protein [Clostridium botulinum]|uniref:patatin-like phospholipase family protein n=1 Tax=Clostridium botulinum TaxID=1491 RepID=UPI001E5F40AE|nr:patatin-like phospholipase family protein [Clostridium botulinum]MCC5438067.1 patatin-like phospholipase family protein [Clostridium botulinum]NFR59402.1 phospholipase [Clostridium botulinum]